MSVLVGINGYGRIGRIFHRIVLARAPGAGVAVGAINDPAADASTLAFLLEHDSVYGGLGTPVEGSDGELVVGGPSVAVYGCADPSEVPWEKAGTEIVVESSGRFRRRAQAAGHLRGSVHHVVISAPSPDADVTVCLGVNDGALDPQGHQVVANASCTTNCLAPMARVLDERFGIEHGYMTTVHAFTTDQNLLDLPRTSRAGKADLRRMRVAPLSIVPTSTGATQAVGKVLPGLDGRLDGLALRVPVPDGSVVDLVATLHTEVDRDEVNRAFAEAAADPSYRGVIEYTEQPLVSADIVGNAASCVFSAADTRAGKQMVKVLGWYDNEWGYAARLLDLVELLVVGGGGGAR